MSDTYMVLADLTDNEVDLLLFLIEKQVDSTDEPSGVELWTADDLQNTWMKLSNAMDRLEAKIKRLTPPATTVAEESKPTLDELVARDQMLWD